MPRFLPSQIAQAIDQMFGPSRNEIDARMITAQYRTEVQTLLYLLDEVPRELIDLPSQEYLEFSRCRAELATTLARWNVGDDAYRAKSVGGKDAVERIRRLIKQCQDQLPPAEPELPFIKDLDARFSIEERVHAAWTDFGVREWMGATVFAGAALEALLLWALKQRNDVPGRTKKIALDELHLADLITHAVKGNLIGPETEGQARLAKDARNLIHPGVTARSGLSCTKSTALTALAGVHRVIDDLSRSMI
jgi:hypothetical protein